MSDDDVSPRLSSVRRFAVVVVVVDQRRRVVLAALPREHRARVRRGLHAQHHEQVPAVVDGALVEQPGLAAALSGHQRRAPAPFPLALRVPRVAVAVHRAVARLVRPVPDDLLRPAEVARISGYYSKRRREACRKILNSFPPPRNEIARKIS